MSGGGQSSFGSTEMTPRAWRMLSYACVGIFLYGAVVIAETLQNYHLNKIDKQMQEIYKQE